LARTCSVGIVGKSISRLSLEISLVFFLKQKWLKAVPGKTKVRGKGIRIEIRKFRENKVLVHDHKPQH
jgi:hypothetical protein